VVAVSWVLGLFATYLWLIYSFERIPYTQPYGEQMQGNLGSIAAQIGLAVAHSIPGLVVVAVIVVLVRATISLARVFFSRVERGEFILGSLDAHTVLPTRRLVEAGLWLFALALAFPFLPGSHTDAFKGVSVLVGVIASIGASGVIGQAAAGLSLVYSRAIRTGEYVRVGETEGTVMKLGFFATSIRTPAGEEVALPNLTVMQGAIRNYSRAQADAGLAVDVSLSIGYDTPWRLVESMMLEAARRTSEIAPEPKPLVRQLRLEDFYPVYQLVAFTPRESRVERPDVLNRLHANIQDVFAENGVQIMSPHYLGDPAEPKVPPKA
jgi:small-conductance mechanosensitive channel